MATKKKEENKKTTSNPRGVGELHRGQGTGRANAPKGELPPYTSKTVPLGTYSGNKKASPSKGELHRGQGVKPANRGMNPAEEQRYQALIDAAKSKTVPIKSVTPEYRKSRLEPIKTMPKKELQPIKTMTAEDRKRRLDPIKSKRK